LGEPFSFVDGLMPSTSRSGRNDRPT